jgi:anionic cell wall polymer biosynthesis LytR-Cps2A-Psr (LCP) family protein
MKGWKVPKGMVHMDGAKALAYSRERYAYVNGDNHRGQNQEDVIAAIINKVSSSKTIISNYNKILNIVFDI